MTTQPFSFESHLSVQFGAGSIEALKKLRALKSATRIALVTDSGVRAAGLVDKVAEAIGDKLAFIDDGVVPDADTVHIDALAARVSSEGVDALVALGGGSVIDSVKAVAAVVKKGAPIASLAGIATIRAPLMPIVAIPTTSGTGAEATQFVVVKDHARGEKVILMDQSLVPAASLLDPTLLTGLPRAITAATGVDALTHAVEALASRMANPLGDAYALEAIRILIDDAALARSLDAPDDVAARGAMLSAAHLAGHAISTSMLGACHAFAHAVGAMKGVAHGLANGLFLVPVMRLNIEKSAGRYARIGRMLGGTGDARALAEHAIARVEEVVHTVAGIPTALTVVGVQESDLDALTALVMRDPDLATNPVRIDDARARLVLAERM